MVLNKIITNVYKGYENADSLVDGLLRVFTSLWEWGNTFCEMSNRKLVDIHGVLGSTDKSKRAYLLLFCTYHARSIAKSMILKALHFPYLFRYAI